MERGPLRLVLLGGVDLRDGAGAEVSPVLAQPKRLALLAYLAMAPESRFRRRDAIVGLFWPEMDEGRARHSVNRGISFLRGWLGNDVIVSRGKEEVGVASQLLWCDAPAFEAAIAAGDNAAAVELYSGDFLSGFYVARAPELEDWIHRERERLRRLACTAAWAWAAEAEKAGQFETALARAQHAFELDQLDEPALRRLLALLDRTGDRLGAERVYADFVRVLDREFEVEPSPETRKLMEIVRTRVRTYTSGIQRLMAMPPSSAAPVAPVTAAVPAAPVPVPIGEPQEERPRRRTLAMSIAGVAIVAAIAASALLVFSRRDTPAAVSAAANTVLVLPFTRTGGEEVEFLRSGAVEILSTDLLTPGVVATVDPRAVRAYLDGRAFDPGSADALAAAAKHFGARYVVVGGVAELRGQLRVNASLMDMSSSGARIANVDAHGPSTTAFELFEDVSRQLLVSLPGARLGEAPRSTSSLRALRAYLQGELLYLHGRFAESLDAYQQAMREDSTFAAAAYRFNVTGDWTGSVPEAVLDEALARAARHSERLPEPERMLIEARVATKRLELDRADELYVRILRAQPDNLEAWYQLGDLRFHWGSPLGRSYRLSKDAFERVRHFDPTNGPALIHLARIAAGDGRREELDTLIQQLGKLQPDARITEEAGLLSAVVLGDATAKQRALNATIEQGPQRPRDGARLLAAYTRDLASAARLASVYAERGPADGPRRDEALTLESIIEIGRGRPDAAARLLPPGTPIAVELRALALMMPWITPNPDELRQIRAALPGIRRDSSRVPAPYLPRRVFLEGMLAIRAKDSAAARAAIDLLGDTRALPSPFNAYARFFARVLTAAALESRGRAADALAALGPATVVEQGLPTPASYPFEYSRYLRATLLEQSGQLDEALKWYATFPEPEGCDVAFRAASYVAQSRIHARLGKNDLAAADAAAARELWRSAEPEIARVLAQSR